MWRCPLDEDAFIFFALIRFKELGLKNYEKKKEKKEEKKEKEFGKWLIHNIV